MRPTNRTIWRPAALAAAISILLAPTPALASGYWSGFIKWWGGFLGEANGVVMTALVIGAISLFIITRGKWAK